MADVHVLTESDLRDVVGLGQEELAAVEAVYPLISSGQATMPPIMRIDVEDHNGEIDIKSAYLPGFDGIAIKVSAGFFDNPQRGLPSLGGLMVVLDAQTGVPRAALFDNGWLTDLRTALAGAVAADHLARPDASVAGVVGAGVQAGLQLEALTLVRDIEHARIWARRHDRAVELAQRLSSDLGIAVDVADSPAAAADGADVLVATTPATEPLIDATGLHPGLHVTAVGSDAEHKQELDPTAIEAADRFVCDHVGQSLRLGELRAAADAGYDTDRAVELGAVIAGTEPGRSGPDDVTICDLTGTGAQDTAIASLAVKRCLDAGLGTRVVA
jgi:ornithine cyclodeaminase